MNYAPSGLANSAFKVCDALLRTNAVKATEYFSPTLIIRAVRKRYGKRIDKRHNIEISLTMGRPNYVERDFIELCQKAGEPFPIKKIQLKAYNPKPAKPTGRKRRV